MKKQTFFLLLTLLGLFGYAHASLIALYNFDDATNLSKNTGRIATNTFSTFAGAVYTEEGKFGGAAYFPTVSNAIASALSGADASNFTLSFHIKVPDTPVPWKDYLSLGTSGNASWVFEATNTTGNYDVYNIGGVGGGSGSITGNGTLLNNAWHHIAITVSENLLTLYHDGVAVGSRAYTGSGTLTHLRLANRIGDNIRASAPILDDVAIFNTALSASEISQLSSTAVVPEPAQHSEWKLIWNDEFNGNAIDYTKWSHWPRGTPDWSNTASSDPRCYEIGGGTLRLIGIKNPDTATDPAEYLTGTITSRGKFDFTYGKVEIRARFKSARGAWPALWMLGSQGVYPHNGEIDLMEHLNFENNVHQTIHTHYTLNIDKDKKGPVQFTTPPIDKNQFNTYGAEWDTEKIVFTVNGNPTLTYPRVPEAGFAQWPFVKPFYLILSMQIGGTWVGNADPKDYPADLEIDWVRIYQRPLVSTVIDSLHETVTMTWQSVPGRRYVLEYATSADPDNWLEALPQAAASEEVLKLEIPLSGYNAVNNYRLRDVEDDTTTPVLKIISFTVNTTSKDMILKWESEPGRTYHVEYSDNLTDAVWQTIEPPITASDTVTTLSMPYDPEVKRRFFRLR